MYIKKKERLKLVGFNDTWLILIGIPFFSFFFPLMVFGLSPLDDLTLFITAFFISATYIFVYWQVGKWIVLYIRKRFSLLKDYNKRIILQSLAVITSTFLLCVISEFLEICFAIQSPYFNASFFNIFMASLIITTIIISLYEGAYAFQLFKSGLVKNEELQRKNTQAQLDALKSQVNPHFLFNSLNTLISVIPEDSKTAVKFAENLASVYRYILEIRDKELITLEEELECINAYIYLLSTRFGEHIKFEFSGLENTQNQYVVPLSIQMLVENAVKHNVVSQTRHLTITISTVNNELKVCNNLQEKTKPEQSTKVGLKNIEKRYNLLANKSIKIQKEEGIFCVYLPILNLKELN